MKWCTVIGNYSTGLWCDAARCEALTPETPINSSYQTVTNFSFVKEQYMFKFIYYDTLIMWRTCHTSL